MGLLNKMMGLGGEKSDRKKEEIQGIFNSKVEDAESYTVVAAMNMLTEKKLLKEVRTFFNYIIGYKDGDDPEIVIMSTESDLSYTNDPVYCKRSECLEAKYMEKTGNFTITHPALGKKPVDFSIIASTAWGGYVIDVSYLDEYEPFAEFYKSRFSK